MSLKIKKKKRRHTHENIANKKWFDKECRIQRHNLRKVANKKHQNPNNIEQQVTILPLKNIKIL